LRKILKIIVVAQLILLFSCGEKIQSNTEGIIEYKVSYPKMDETDFMFDFMPKSMTMKFKDDTYMTNLSAGMGYFKANFICNKEDNKFVQLVKLWDKKYSMELEGGAIAVSMDQMPKFNVEFTEEHKKILNYTCKKAIITIDDGSNDAFSVYYTDQIDIATPNWCNQFVGINGVLLEYQYEMHNVCMRFTATDIVFEEINNEEFIIPEDYVPLTENEMNKTMASTFSSFTN